MLHLVHSQGHTNANVSLEETSSSIMRVLLYFDVFKHPLMAWEVAEFCDTPSLSESQSEDVLKHLVDIGQLNEYEGYFYLGSDRTKVKRRLEANVRACKRMGTARFFSRIISLFPYTRAVMISGSLSKGVMHNDSDIDFFVITKPGRLWLNRTLLALFKKVFLLNSHRNFCINYFVDENHMAIPDRNIFTATEIAFLIPMCNYELHREFLKVNDWHRRYYPNLEMRGHKPDHNPILRRFLEFPLNRGMGDFLERICMKVSIAYWKKKHHINNLSNPDSDIYSTPSVSKYHPKRQQFVVLESYASGLKHLHDIAV